MNPLGVTLFIVFISPVKGSIAFCIYTGVHTPAYDISSLHGLKSTGLHTPVKAMFPNQLLAISFPLPSQLTTGIWQEFDRSLTGLKSFQTPCRLSANSLRELRRERERADKK